LDGKPVELFDVEVEGTSGADFLDLSRIEPLARVSISLSSPEKEESANSVTGLSVYW
jgi:hypothetical protein